jgi:hypothetical protein
MALRHHLAGVGGHHLGRDRPADQLADAHDRLTGITALLGEQAGVGGGAGQHAPGGDLLHLGHGTGVDEQPHAKASSSSGALRPEDAGG